MTREEITALLKEVVHPETGADILSAGVVTSIEAGAEGVHIALTFPKQHDPFASSIRRKIIQQISENNPALAGKIEITVTEPPKSPQRHAAPSLPGPSPIAGVDRIIAVASGKGGVGKSTVAANLAVALQRLGYRVGILDADIYGPSMPKIFGLEGYRPMAVRDGDQELIVPAESQGIQIISIGFFINPDDALIWRGPMATGALKQMIRQTHWGKLDFLVADLPPGTGDVHLTLLQELKVDGAVMVSTPHVVALADVRRSLKMFRTPQMALPVLGIIENMAWFTPAELPQNRYYLFGHGGAAALAAEEQVTLLGEIPIFLPAGEGTDGGASVAPKGSEAEGIYEDIARKIVAALP